MRIPRATAGLFVLLGCLTAEGALAGSYDFETGLVLGNSSTDVVSALGVIGSTPVPEAGLGTSKTDSDTIELFGTWPLLRLSLFPVDEFEFGAGYQRREVNAFAIDGNTYEAFAGWFPSDRVELRARYSMNDFDSLMTQEYDNDEIGIGLSIRF